MLRREAGICVPQLAKLPASRGIAMNILNPGSFQKLCNVHVPAVTNDRGRPRQLRCKWPFAWSDAVVACNKVF